RRTRAPGGHVAHAPPPSVMNSRRFNWSNGIRRPVTRGPVVEYRIGEDRSGGDGTIFRPVSGWRVRPGGFPVTNMDAARGRPPGKRSHVAGMKAHPPFELRRRPARA